MLGAEAIALGVGVDDVAFGVDAGADGSLVLVSGSTTTEAGAVALGAGPSWAGSRGLAQPHGIKRTQGSQRDVMSARRA
ncbi:MAG: hypothetical protein U0271_01715 [Polyangiaceae bacterium]